VRCLDASHDCGFKRINNGIHGRSQDLERVGAPGVYAGFLVGGTMERPKAPSEARRREAPERRGG